MKKGQALSLNTVVIAAMVILVLIVIAFILLRNAGTADEKLNGCATQGGECIDKDLSCSDAGNGNDRFLPRPDLTCNDEFKKCCVKFGE